MAALTVADFDMLRRRVNVRDNALTLYALVRALLPQSGWRDSKPRPLRPERGAHPGSKDSVGRRLEREV